MDPGLRRDDGLGVTRGVALCRAVSRGVARCRAVSRGVARCRAVSRGVVARVVTNATRSSFRRRPESIFSLKPTGKALAPTFSKTMKDE
jgi:hypothetical protein